MDQFETEKMTISHWQTTIFYQQTSADREFKYNTSSIFEYVIREKQEFFSQTSQLLYHPLDAECSS
jgi:hypothetical protein